MRYRHKLNYQFKHDRVHFGEPYKKLLSGFRPKLPDQVDLRASMSPIEDQGDEGDCAAHATAGAIEFLQLLELKTPYKNPTPFIYGPGGTFQRVSRQQLYWGVRSIEGTTDQDAGVQDLADMAKVCQDVGVAQENLWPYTPQDLYNPPPQAVLDDAKGHKLPNWYELHAGYQIKHCLWSGFPFMLGFQVFESFMSDDVARSGIMPMPQDGEQIEGGHAVLAVGYDDSKSAFIIRNSWGQSWGMDGYFLMPYEFMDSEFCGDFITLRSVPSATP